LNNSMFQMLNWSIFNSFSGKYEAIIYKLCKDYIGVGQTPYLTLNEFRDYIGLEPNEYEEFKVFNRYILSGPIKRINECEISDIIIEVAFRKESRKVIGLQFKMSKKKQTMLDFGDNPAFFAAKTHISIEKQQKYLASYVADDISLSIERANIYAAELEKKGQQVDFGGLYHKAITENWGKDYAEKLRIAEETNQNKIKKVKSQQKIAIEESKKISDEIELKKQANELIEALSLEEKNAYFERYKLEANPLPLFIKSGTRSAAFKMWLGRELINQQS